MENIFSSILSPPQAVNHVLEVLACLLEGVRVDLVHGVRQKVLNEFKAVLNHWQIIQGEISV